MCAQIFFVTSVRGSGCVPTILARCSEGCIGFIKALFFALGVVFAILLSILVASVPSSVITVIVTDRLADMRKGDAASFGYSLCVFCFPRQTQFTRGALHPSPEPLVGKRLTRLELPELSTPPEFTTKMSLCETFGHKGNLQLWIEKF